MASYAPYTAGPNSSLSQRYGPDNIPQELVAENGLFQPKLTLAQKSPKLTPRPEPSLNLGPSEVRASGHHGVIKWGHDAKITKIGLISTRGSPGQGMANGSQERRQDLKPISECTT